MCLADRKLGPYIMNVDFLLFTVSETVILFHDVLFRHSFLNLFTYGCRLLQ